MERLSTGLRINRGKDDPAESASPSGSKIEDKAAEPPNPVPPAAPLPEPAGSPSGPT